MTRLRGLILLEPDMAQPAERVPRPVPPGLAVLAVTVGRRVQRRRGPRLRAARQEPREAVDELVREEYRYAEDCSLEADLGLGLGLLQALVFCPCMVVYISGALLDFGV